MKKEEKEKTDVTVKPAPRKPSRASRREKKQGKDVAKEPVNQNGDPVDMIFMDIWIILSLLNYVTKEIL